MRALILVLVVAGVAVLAASPAQAGGPPDPDQTGALAVKDCPAAPPGDPYTIGDTVTCNFSFRNEGATPATVTLMTETSPVPGGTPIDIACTLPDGTTEINEGDTLPPATLCSMSIPFTIPNDPALCNTLITDRADIELLYPQFEPDLEAGAFATHVLAVVCAPPTTTTIPGTPTTPPTTPTFAFTGAIAVCVVEVPTIVISFANTFPELAGVTGTLTMTAANGTVVSTQPLVYQPNTSVNLLYPGTRVNADGSIADVPGWNLNADGFWVRDPSDAFLREGILLTFTVNPTATATVTYPPESSACANPDGPFPPGASPPELPATGGEETSLALLAAAALAMGAALMVAAVRRRARP